MRAPVTIATWEGLALYGLGLVVGFAAGYALRWAFMEPAR